MLHQSTTSRDTKKNDLRHEEDPYEITTYVAAIVVAMVEETKKDACPSLMEVT